jgi:hypothetical protein
MKNKRAFRVYKALYGKRHQEDPAPPPKPEPLPTFKEAINDQVRDLAAQFARMGVSARDLSEAFGELASAIAREERAEQLRNQMAAPFGRVSFRADPGRNIRIPEPRRLTVDEARERLGLDRPLQPMPMSYMGIPIVTSRHIPNGRAVMVQDSIVVGLDMARDTDFSAIEERVVARRVEQANTEPLTGDELNAVNTRGTRTGRWTNPDANIRGFRRGR